MSAFNQPGRARPQARPGDWERAIEILAATGADKETKTYLTDLRDASAAHDTARETAEAATAESKQREAVALEVEEGARSELAELAAHKTAYDTRIRNERAELDAERRRLDEQAKTLDAEGADLTRREAAILRAFDAYQGETT